MTQTLPTVAIHHPDNHAVRMIINADNLCDGHKVWESEEADFQTPAEAEGVVQGLLEAQERPQVELRAYDVGEPSPAVNDLPSADTEPASQPAIVVPALRVGRGPRGKWYVKRGKENLAGPFETEYEAVAKATT